MVEEGEDYERRASFLLEKVVDEVQREEEVVDEAQREQEGYLEFQVEGRLGQIQESQEREIGRGMVGGGSQGGVWSGFQHPWSLGVVTPGNLHCWTVLHGQPHGPPWRC